AVGTKSHAYAVAVQPGDDKIVAVGTTDANNGDFAVARYNPDGTLDATFGTNGRVTTDFGHDDKAAAVALQGDGKIVAVGSSEAAGGNFFSSKFAVARYNPDGSPDLTFGTNGRVVTGISTFSSDDSANAVAIQPFTNKIVVAGSTGSGNGVTS